MALYNCSACDTKDDLVWAAEWAMDCLMNGVGVGFSTYWRGTATAPNKEDRETLIIDDSREGWVLSLIKLLSAYIYSPKYGTSKFPKFDYSLIRAEGLPIKGFGGTSSGSAPLEKMHTRIEGYLDAFCIGRLETKAKTWKEFKNEDGTSDWKEVEIEVSKEYNHTRLITDIFNSIGACIVAGNCRRSAEISLGEVEDSTFINLKNYEMNPERSEIGWMSNNSVVLKADHSYEDFSYIPEMAKRIRDNGEPGLINLYNIQKYGRFGKEHPDKASLVNPCFSADTLIATADGRNAVTIQQLAEEGKDVPVYSIDPVTKKVSIKWGRNPRITGYNKKLIRIHFTYPNKSEYIDVTPNHKIILNNGQEIEAKDLKKGDSLPQFKKGKFSSCGYIQIALENNKNCSEHRMIAEFYKPEMFYKTYKEGEYNGCCLTHNVVVHHIDENKTNNSIDNLDITTAGDHMRIHSKEYIGSGNPMYGRKQTYETKALIAQKAIERCSDPKYRKMLSDAQTPETRKKASEKMIIQKHIWDQEKWDKIEKETDLKTLRDEDGKLYVIKICENQKCMKEICCKWGEREKCYCSLSCSNTKREAVEARKLGQAKTWAGRLKDNFYKQAMVYEDLYEKTEIVMKKDWEKECKCKGITYRFQKESPNPWIAKSWKHFKDMVDIYNHRVSHIEELEGDHTVYNITVDENHTLAIATAVKDSGCGIKGVYLPNCGEIPLEGGGETCNLSEVFPPRCQNQDRFNLALEYATFLCNYCFPTSHS